MIQKSKGTKAHKRHDTSVIRIVSLVINVKAFDFCYPLHFSHWSLQKALERGVRHE